MKNGYNIAWTENAKTELTQILDYIEMHLGEFSLRKYVKLLDKSIQNLALFPTSHPKSRNGLRRFVISKYSTIYYKLLDYNIVILSIFDNRKIGFKEKKAGKLKQ